MRDESVLVKCHRQRLKIFGRFPVGVLFVSIMRRPGIISAGMSAIATL